MSLHTGMQGFLPSGLQPATAAATVEIDTSSAEFRTAVSIAVGNTLSTKLDVSEFNQTMSTKLDNSALYGSGSSDTPAAGSIANIVSGNQSAHAQNADDIVTANRAIINIQAREADHGRAVSLLSGFSPLDSQFIGYYI